MFVSDIVFQLEESHPAEVARMYSFSKEYFPVQADGSLKRGLSGTTFYHPQKPTILSHAFTDWRESVSSATTCSIMLGDFFLVLRQREFATP
eukprot:SAG31_NODE_3604_length_4078_cov_1.491832_3_plen_92_part_00